MSDVLSSKELAKYLAHLAGCTRGALKGSESRMMRVTLKDSEAIQTAADLLSATHEPPAVHPPQSVAIYDRCPFTGRPHFMDIEHPELGLVPTYGGPFDSFTIPIPDDDDERTLRSERFDHDQGAWVEGGEPLAMNVVTNEEFVDLHTLREERAAEPPAASQWQPIDTAPKGDGFECIIAEPGNYPKHNNCLVGEARRYEDHWYWAQMDPSDGAPVYPTHWMPMPSPPETKEARRDPPGSYRDATGELVIPSRASAETSGGKS